MTGLKLRRCLISEAGVSCWIDVPLPVSDLVRDGDAQVKASILGDDTAPPPGAGSAQLGHAPHLAVPVRQLQVIPEPEGEGCNILRLNSIRLHLESL